MNKKASKFGGYVIGVVAVSLFAYLLILFAQNLGVDYGKDTTDIGGERFNVTGMNQTINLAQERGQNYTSGFTSESEMNVEEAAGIWKTTKTMWRILTVPFVTFTYILRNVFQLSNTIIGVIVFMLSVSIIFAAWRLYKRGD